MWSSTLTRCLVHSSSPLFLLAMNGPRSVITCSRGSPEISTGSTHFQVRTGREQHVPDSSNHALFPENEGTAEGTSYQMVRLVCRHFAADERLPVSIATSLRQTLPFSGIFAGFSACYSYSNHTQDHGQWQVCMCV